MLYDKKNIKSAPTIMDVAKLANVSKSSVSRFINKQEGVSRSAEIKIKDAIEKLNYKPNTVARALKAKSTKSLGLIIPSIENPVFPPLVKVIEDTALKYGFSTILCNSEGDIEQEVKYLELLVEKQVDGIIFNALGGYDKRFEIAKDSGTPIIVVGKRITGFNSSNVTVNNFKGAYLAVEHLITTGMKNIAFLSGQLESSSAINDRYDGYKAALEAHGIKYKEDLVVKEIRSFEGGIFGTNELLERDVAFDSIFASNDIMAIGCMEKLIDKGYKIPYDISVIGYDDIPSSRIIKPRLSTVLNPAKEFGAEAVKMILRMIYTKEDLIEEKIFDPEIIIRESTL